MQQQQEMRTYTIRTPLNDGFDAIKFWDTRLGQITEEWIHKNSNQFYGLVF